MTKWETVKVSIFRLLAFLVSIVVSWVIFLHIEKIWIAYGLFTFIIVFSRNWQVGGGHIRKFRGRGAFFGQQRF